MKHEISVSQRTPVMIINVKFELSQAHAYWNFLAQAMCELHCMHFLFVRERQHHLTAIILAAFNLNRHHDLQGFPVSAILTDSKHWEFISYNGTNFFKDESIVFTPTQFSNGIEYSTKMLEGKFQLSRR